MNEHAERDIHEWLIAYISKEFNINESEIALDQPMTNYGITSAEAVILIADLESWLGRPIPEALLSQNPSIRALGSALVRNTV